MISELLPRDIIDLIVSTYGEGISDPDVDAILPPWFVRNVVLAEQGIKAPLGEAQQALARDWCRVQAEAQEKAMKINHTLNEVEPLTQEMALRGNLPKWAVEKWAVTLLLDWSADLPIAVMMAEQYLLERTTASS